MKPNMSSDELRKANPYELRIHVCSYRMMLDIVEVIHEQIESERHKSDLLFELICPEDDAQE